MKQMTIGEIIKAERQRKGYTQLQLSRLIGTSKSSVVAWEINERDIPSRVVYALCDELGITPNQLFGYDRR